MNKTLNKILLFLLLFSVALPEAWPEPVRQLKIQVLSGHLISQIQVGDLTLSANRPQDFPRLLVPKNGIPIRLALPNGTFRRLAFPLEIKIRNGHLEIFAEVPLEKYVATVLASELPSNFPMESLKAQAVLIRTLALKGEKRHLREGFDFCDTTHCQLFLPPEKIPPIVLAAVQQTRDMVLTHRGQLVAGLYHSTCGGHTSANQRVFGGVALPYLQGVNDGDYCTDSPHHDWKTVISREELRNALHQNRPVTQINLLDQDEGGRVFQLETYSPLSQKWPAQAFLLQVGRGLGWNKLKSAFFSIQPKEDSFIFSGRGLGHGVGLCQWGARGMALHGHDFRQILHHYFPGTQVRRI
jgi:stage II sporulation protein D